VSHRLQGYIDCSSHGRSGSVALPRTKIELANPAFLKLADVEARRAERRAEERRSVTDIVASVEVQLNPLLLELMRVEVVVGDILLDPSACCEVRTSWLLDDQSFSSVSLRITAIGGQITSVLDHCRTLPVFGVCK
jgi:hypothetical protein